MFSIVSEIRPPTTLARIAKKSLCPAKRGDPPMHIAIRFFVVAVFVDIQLGRSNSLKNTCILTVDSVYKIKK